jgi:hypothetical protein
MLLSKLTPAETLLIRHGDQVSVTELLKYTLMDLLLKQVLMMDKVERQLNKRDPVREYKYVSVGKNFGHYANLPHELPFLLPFQKNSDRRLLFRSSVQIGYENAQSQRALQRAVRSSPLLQDVFSASFFERIFGIFEHTAKGLELKNQVEREMRQMEQKLPDLIANDREKALEALKIIGGNVFLLHGLDFELLKEIDEALAKEVRQDQGGGGCGGCGWTTFDTYSGDFNTSCSSDSSGDSSGCSSGDGGCGGGCGGD